MRYYTKLSTRVLVILAILLLCTISGCATKKSMHDDPLAGLVMEYRLPEEGALRYRTTNEMKQNLKIQDQNVDITSRREYLFSLRSSGIENGSHRIEATIDSLHIAVTAPQGDFSPDVSAIVGKSFDILLSPQGRELELTGVDSLRYDLGPSGKRSISPDFQTLFPDLPDRPVKIGDTWESEDVIIDESSGSKLRVTLKSLNRLDGFETVNGLECARITSEVTGYLEGEGDQQRAKMTFEGDVVASDTWYFAYERGIFVKLLSESKTEGSVTVSGPKTMTIPMTMEMTFQTELEVASTPGQDLKLIIEGFTDDSSLQKAGALKGDRILTYAGEDVTSVEKLRELRDAAETPEVEVVLQHGDERVEVIVPKGHLGVFLKEIVPEHGRDEDAVVIDGIGKLAWGTGMDNSFLGAVCRIDEKFGLKTSYNDIVGLSGYGFRLHFFDGWCPSSPDATCGKDVGAEVLGKLGYAFDSYFLLTPDTDEKIKAKAKTEEELRAIIKDSIDLGWPVIAIDLIGVPEWGLVTGYQKGGKDLFCRTYFDRTEGYEIARKTPWVIYVIRERKDPKLALEYKNSLLLAKELYDTEKYDMYFSGMKALDAWLTALKDENNFGVMDPSRLQMVHQTNWWIYYSLSMARANAVQYLTENRERFGVDTTLIDELIRLYRNEVEILQKGLETVPSPHAGNRPSDWTGEARATQASVLEKLRGIEGKVGALLTLLLRH